MTDGRPRTRGDCQHGLRPCPWVACRYHLAEVGVDDRGRLRLPVLSASLPTLATNVDADAWTETAADAVVQMRESCMLDVADRYPDGATLEAVGSVYRVTRERIRQIERKTLGRLKRKRRRLM